MADKFELRDKIVITRCKMCPNLQEWLFDNGECEWFCWLIHKNNEGLVEEEPEGDVIVNINEVKNNCPLRGSKLYEIRDVN